MSNFDILKNLMDAKQDTGTKAYDTTATVRRIEGSTAWVHIPGGVDETPVRLTINAKAGDTVQVRVGGGTAWLVGNQTAPPTDDTKADAAQGKADMAQLTATKAGKVAASAKKIADNTNQYFWMVSEGTDTGAHITEVTQEEFLADPDNGGGNLLARSNGIAIRDGLTELATFSSGGLDVTTYDSNNNDVEIAHLGYGEGNAESGTAVAPYYTLGVRLSGSEVGNYSMAEGNMVTSSGYASHTEGCRTTASGEGAHAEGWLTTASGDISHAEGWSTTASGEVSHAEGLGTTASGTRSHAEGNLTTASGLNSHAEGYKTTASGADSHAGGYKTTASSDYQTAIGKCNVEDTASTYAFIIGNGTAERARSNALTVDWDGNVDIAGAITSGGDSLLKAVSVSLGSQTVNSNGVVAGTFDVSASIPSGYTAIAAFPRGTSSYAFQFYSCWLASSTAVYVQVIRRAENATTITPTVVLLCVKGL